MAHYSVTKGIKDYITLLICLNLFQGLEKNLLICPLLCLCSIVFDYYTAPKILISIKDVTMGLYCCTCFALNNLNLINEVSGCFLSSSVS